MLFSAILNPSLDCFSVVFLFQSYISVKSHLTLSQCFILELNSLLFCTASASRCCINAVNGKRPNHKRVLLSADYPKMWLNILPQLVAFKVISSYELWELRFSLEPFENKLLLFYQQQIRPLCHGLHKGNFIFKRFRCLGLHHLFKLGLNLPLLSEPLS